MTKDPRKVYVIAGHRFTMAELTVELKDRLGDLLNSIGIKTWDEFLQQAFIDVVNTLAQRRVLRQTFDLVLVFDDRSVFHKWARILSMRLRGQDKASLLKTMTVPQQVEVFYDFFLDQLGILITFSNSLNNMVSSLEQMRKATKQPSASGT